MNVLAAKSRDFGFDSAWGPYDGTVFTLGLEQSIQWLAGCYLRRHVRARTGARGELFERGARVAFVARTRTRVEQVANELAGVHGIVGDVSLKSDIHPIALQILGALVGSTS